MPETPTIRPAEPDDLDWIVRMLHALAAYEHCGRYCNATPDRLAPYVFGERPAVEVLVADLDARPAGLAMFLPTFAAYVCTPSMFLEALIVEPELRGRGVGLALMRELARIALERGYGRMEFWVHGGNRDTVRFYERLGAWPAEPWRAYWMFRDALRDLVKSGGEQPA